jgi:hypothetical protein
MMYAAASRVSSKMTGPDPSHHKLLHHFTGHLVDEEYSYFTQWDRLIDLEADASGSLIARAWLLGSDDRETETSKSISSLDFDPAESSPKAVFDESWFSGIAFKRSPTAKIQTPLSNVGFEPGCRVIVSTDSTSLMSSSGSTVRRSNAVRPQMHIVRGIVHKATDTHLQILASRDDLTRIENIVNVSASERILFRLDRDDTATGIGTLRQNLVNLLTGDIKSPNDEPGSPMVQSRLSWLRDVLIRLRKPVFDKTLVQSMFTPIRGTKVGAVPGCDLMDLCFESLTLNPDQRAAAEQVWLSRESLNARIQSFL